MKVPPQINSFADLWDITVKKYPKNKLIEDSTYTEVDKNMRKVGSWLLDNNHQMIFLYCKNSPNWTLVDLACWNYGQINVPLYDTLGS